MVSILYKFIYKTNKTNNIKYKFVTKSMEEDINYHKQRYNINKINYYINCNDKTKLTKIQTINYNNSIYYGELVYGYKHGCGTLIYPNGYSYEGFWENNTVNGFSMYLDDNDNVLISGNKKNGKYNGLVKFHKDFVSNANITKFDCLFMDGVRKNCYIEYNNVTHILDEIILDKMKLLKNIIL
jgi:hypothetical protein